MSTLAYLSNTESDYSGCWLGLDSKYAMFSVDSFIIPRILSTCGADWHYQHTQSITRVAARKQDQLVVYGKMDVEVSHHEPRSQERPWERV